MQLIFDMCLCNPVRAAPCWSETSIVSAGGSVYFQKRAVVYTFVTGILALLDRP